MSSGRTSCEISVVSLAIICCVFDCTARDAPTADMRYAAGRAAAPNSGIRRRRNPHHAMTSASPAATASPRNAALKSSRSLISPTNTVPAAEPNENPPIIMDIARPYFSGGDQSAAIAWIIG